MSNMTRNFDRDFRHTKNVVNFFIMFTALVTFGIMGTLAYLAFEVISHPEEISRGIGESLGQAYQGFKEIQK